MSFLGVVFGHVAPEIHDRTNVAVIYLLEHDEQTPRFFRAAVLMVSVAPYDAYTCRRGRDRAELSRFLRADGKQLRNRIYSRPEGEVYSLNLA